MEGIEFLTAETVSEPAVTFPWGIYLDVIIWLDRMIRVGFSLTSSFHKERVEAARGDVEGLELFMHMENGYRWQ